MQGGRIGVSSVCGKGSDFKFFVKARRVIATNKASDSEDEVVEDLEKTLSITDRTPQAGKNRALLVDPNYTASLKRKHSASQNPVASSPSSPNTLHVLIVEVGSPQCDV